MNREGLKMKKLVLIINCMILSLFEIGFVSCSKNKVGEEDVFKVFTETFENTIEISGNIEAADEQRMVAASDGTIEKVYFKEGDVIKKGQTLCLMDDLQQQYNIANMEFQLAQKRLTASPKELKLLEMQLQIQKKALENKKSIARFDGVIAKLAVAEGDYLEATNEIATIIDRSYLKATVEIAETDASKLRLNQKVKFTFPAYKEPVEGYVSYFPAVGKITSRGSTVVEAEIRIENPPKEILTGYSFTGTIQITEPIINVLVDSKAVSFSDEGTTVTKLEKNGTESVVLVEVVPYGKDYVKVISGLSDGDIVVNKKANLKSGSKRREKDLAKDRSENSKQNRGGVLGGMGGPRMMQGGKR